MIIHVQTNFHPVIESSMRKSWVSSVSVQLVVSVIQKMTRSLMEGWKYLAESGANSTS